MCNSPALESSPAKGGLGRVPIAQIQMGRLSEALLRKAEESRGEPSVPTSVTQGSIGLQGREGGSQGEWRKAWKVANNTAAFKVRVV